MTLLLAGGASAVLWWFWPQCRDAALAFRPYGDAAVTECVDCQQSSDQGPRRQRQPSPQVPRQGRGQRPEHIGFGLWLLPETR